MSDVTVAPANENPPPVFGVGEYQGTRPVGHSELVEANHSFQTRSGTDWTPTLGLLSWVPHTADAVTQFSSYHALASWDELTATIYFGPGIAGRRVTIRYAWAPDSWGTIRTLANMATFPTYGTMTVGASEIIAPIAPIVVPAAFTSVSSRLIVSPYALVNRPKFWLQVTADNVGATQAAGHWVEVHFRGVMRCWGSVLA